MKNAAEHSSPDTSVISEIEYVRETLRNNENIGDRIRIDDARTYVEIEFHEYLHISADEDRVMINFDDNAHWHPGGTEDLIEQLTEIANGNVVFVENMCRFHPRRLFFGSAPKRMTRAEFEKKKAKYLCKKYLRIYTGNEIVKRSA